MMDATEKTRIREGRVEVFKPEIITPNMMNESHLEGFGDPEVEQYMDWLRSHDQDLQILKYGFTIKNHDILRYK